MALPEANNSSSVKLDESLTFIDNRCHTSIFPSIHEKNPNDKSEYMLYPTLDYINRILLEEDIDEQFSGHQVAALSDIEKPFYDILGEKYPSLLNSQLVLSQPNSNDNSGTSISTNPISSSSISTSLPQESTIESLLSKEFQRGLEEGMKFLPTVNNLAIDLHVGRFSLDTAHKKNDRSSEIKFQGENAPSLVDQRKTKKSSTDADLNLLEGRNSKIAVHYTEETIRDEMFDKVLLNHGEEYVREEVSHMREIMKCEANSLCTQKENKEGNIYLESLLFQCSEAVACNNHKMAEEFIKEIRKHASPVGDGAQRFACILTDGLEARLAGTGSDTYRQLVNRRISMREVLKAYHMYITACPLLRMTYCFANDYICKVAGNASKIHIIDLGISFGFQWPLLIQDLAKRKSGAPKLRITGIDLPQPGFRPAERIKQIGLRLEDYAKSFGVPFQYQCIASLWECVRIDDLKIDDDEVLIVNSMLRFKHVRDDTFPDSPRDQVLSLIQQIKPKVFVLGILNASFSPFFTTRFRKVMLHYSMLFDMLDELVPRDHEGRQLMERELLGPSIINLVACEGPDWVEQPDTYKQWDKRISRAGFEQVAVDRDIVKYCNEKVKSIYHEEFFIEEESGWMLQGWKGRIYYGHSVWKPKLE